MHLRCSTVGDVAVCSDSPVSVDTHLLYTHTHAVFTCWNSGELRSTRADLQAPETALLAELQLVGLL